MAANRRAGGVELARFEPLTVDQSPAIGTPAGSTAGDIERIGYRMRSISATIGRVADERAAREGAEAGAAAGMDPEFRQLERNTAFARNFDRVGSQVALGQLETQARAEMETVFQEHGNDPIALGQRLDQLRGQLEATSALQQSSVLRAQFGQMFDRNRIVYERQASRATLDAAQASARAQIQTENTARLNALDRMAREAGLDAVADAALTGEMAAMETALVAYGPREAFSIGGETFEADDNRAGALSPEQIAAQLGAARRTVASGRVLGAFSRTRGLADQVEFRDAFLADANDPDGPYPDMTRQDINAIDAAMSRTIIRAQREIDRQRARQERALGRALRNAVDVTGEGLPVGADVFEGIINEAQAIGAGDLAAEAREAAGLAQLADWAWTRPVIELEQLENRTRADIEAAGAASPYQARQLQTLSSVRTQLQSGLNSDPLSTAVRAGIADVPPLVFANEAGEPDMGVFAQSLTERAATAQAVAANYGQVTPRYFTAAERRQLGELIGAGDVERYALAQSLTDALGPQAPAALAELAPDEPLLAHMGGLLTAGALPAAQDMQRGLQLRGTDGWESRLPGATTVLAGGETLPEMRRDMLGDLGTRLPETAAQASAAANEIYNARATRRGLTRDEFDADMYRRAMNEALGAVYLSDGRREVQFGGLAEIDTNGWLGGGKYQLLAPNWLRADRLGDVLDTLSEADLDALPARPHDGRGHVIEAETLGSAWYIPAGENRYLIGFGRRNAENPTVALDEAGLPFVLDLGHLRSRIAQAHPDWVR